MFGIKKIKERLVFVENELLYYRELQEHKEGKKKKKKKHKIPVINRNKLKKCPYFPS